MASRMDSMTSCRFSRPRVSRALNATAAAATAAPGLAKTPPPAEGGGGPAPASGMISLAMTSARRRSCSGLYAELMCQPAPWSGASVSVLGRALLEEGLAADLPGVHDRHDDRVARTVLGDLGLAGGGAGRIEHVLARTAAHRVIGDHEAALFEVLRGHLPEQEGLRSEEHTSELQT